MGLISSSASTFSLSLAANNISSCKLLQFHLSTFGAKTTPQPYPQGNGNGIPIPTSRNGMLLRCWCSSNSNSNSSSVSTSSTPPPRGFGGVDDTAGDKKPPPARGRRPPRLRKKPSSNSQPSNQAPLLSSQIDNRRPDSTTTDLQFQQRLQAVQRSALQQKKSEDEKQYGAIDYDAPIEPKIGSVGIGTKIGAGVAVVIFGLVFALGDFLPSGSVSTTEEATTVDTRISSEERENLKKRLQLFEETLGASPEDSAAVEGAAVTLAELGEYTPAASLLEDLTKKKPSDPDVFRLLGEVKYQLKDYEGSARAYRISAKVSKAVDFEVLRGLTNALLASDKPGEAVQTLLASRESLEKERTVIINDAAESNPPKESSQVDPIQVDLLLGKAYSDWGQVSAAISVYDQLISSHPDDFRGYLAKGIILKENGNIGDAERMFIQARFFAPEKAKALVDKYSR